MSITEPFAAPEYFVNAFDDYEMRDGILTCTGYREAHGERVAVVRIAMPLAGLAVTRANAASVDMKPATPSVRLAS